MTNHNMFESDDEGNNGLPINERGTLEQPLGNKKSSGVNKGLKMKLKPGDGHGQGHDSSIQFSSDDGRQNRMKNRDSEAESNDNE